MAYRDPHTYNIIILVVTVTGQGDYTQDLPKKDANVSLSRKADGEFYNEHGKSWPLASLRRHSSFMLPLNHGPSH